MERTVDHVAFGSLDLDTLRDAAADVGLTPTYGGEHSSGTTHMAIVPFPDGSYLELIAPTPGTNPADAGFWAEHLAADAGPAAWCLDVPDVHTSAKAAIDAGVPVDGPHEAARERPDGRLVEWDMCFEGEDERLPFMIRDRTPRSYRVRRTSDATIQGIQTVVIVTDDQEATTELLARRHRYPTPIDVNGPFPHFSAIPGTPVALCEAADGWLSERVSTVGEGPCAFLLAVNDIEQASESLALGPENHYDDRRMAWLDHELFHRRLGVVERV